VLVVRGTELHDTSVTEMAWQMQWATGLNTSEMSSENNNTNFMGILEKKKATKIGKNISELDFPTDILTGICHFSDEKITVVETPTADSRMLFSMPYS
jgi:hypothetical protein